MIVNAFMIGGASADAPRRLPFIFKPHKSATKAYLEHLQNELEATQRQLYTSQKTCITLRKRVDDQRKDVLTQNVGEVNYVRSNEEDHATIQRQGNEIEELRTQLALENDKIRQQLEQMKLLQAELKEVQQWKEKQVDERKKSRLVGGQENEYKQQIEILSLKLEAAELAAKIHEREASGKSTEKHASQLKRDLESVSTRYAKLSMQLTKRSGTAEYDTTQQQQLEADMDQAIQSVFQTVLGSIENEWELKYQALKKEVDDLTQNTKTANDVRDAALNCLKDASLHNEQQHLQEKLTDELTAELTEKFTKQLTDELTAKIEKRYRKKYKKMQKEIESKTTDQENQQLLQEEIEKIREQYESEYTTKLEHLRQQNKEQMQLQKERMRKLVRALLEREAKQKKQDSAETSKDKGKSEVDSSGASDKNSNTKKKKKVVADSGEELVTTSAGTSSVKKIRSQAGVIPVRGNAVK
jgi:hypothetical protein